MGNLNECKMSMGMKMLSCHVVGDMNVGNEKYCVLSKDHGHLAV